MKELYGNGYVPSIAQAIEEMKAEQGESFSPERINLAELERRTGISRGKLRRLKQNGFRGIPKGSDSGKHKFTKLTGYTGIIDTLLKQGVSNSTVILNRLLESGFEGRLTIVKDYIAAHKHLIPAKRQQIAPQGNRGRRYTTAPGEAYQMDWGFTDVLDYNSVTIHLEDVPRWSVGITTIYSCQNPIFTYILIFNPELGLFSLVGIMFTF